MNQSAFTFEEIHDYSPENFLISPANAEAHKYIKAFPWSNYSLSIHGPKGSGKTYLANMLASNHDVLIIEDIGLNIDQQKLLHQINFAKENGRYILLTSETPLNNIKFTLPDLTSRLSAILSIAISAPDSELFYQLFARYFAARRLKPGDDVINYLATRIERSFAAALDIVAQIEKLSLEQKRNITIPLVKTILKP